MRVDPPWAQLHFAEGHALHARFFFFMKHSQDLTTDGGARLAGISACQVTAQEYQTQRMETLCDGFRNTCLLFGNCARFLLAPATVNVAFFASRALHWVMLGRPADISIYA